MKFSKISFYVLKNSASKLVFKLRRMNINNTKILLLFPTFRKSYFLHNKIPTHDLMTSNVFLVFCEQDLSVTTTPKILCSTRSLSRKNTSESGSSLTLSVLFPWTTFYQPSTMVLNRSLKRVSCASKQSYQNMLCLES